MPDTKYERLYYQLPVSLQNCFFSLYGLGLSKKRYNRFFYEHLRELQQSEWWSKDMIKDYQNKKFVEIVNHAYNTVPFYRKFYDKHNVNIRAISSLDDLQKLPILTKNIVRENQSQMISSQYKRRRLQRCLTSGTTGTPLVIFQTESGLAFQWAIWWRHKRRFDIHVGNRHLTFGARVPISVSQQKPPYWRNDYFNNRVYLSSYHISKRNAHDIVRYLNSTTFDFFTGYPSSMFELANIIEESGLQIKNPPKFIVTGSDALLPHYEETLRRVFMAPVTEQYGMAEFAGNMSKCEQGRFHLDFECCHVEPLTTIDNEFHQLIFTGWGNKAMPYIRYEVGDYGTPMNDACNCGRNSLSFRSIDGRLEDYIITPDGRKLIGMNQVFEYAKNVREIQLYQEVANAVEFRIVPSFGFGDEDKNSLIREFTRRSGTKMNISIRIVDHLERSNVGKMKAVISTIDSKNIN